MKIKSFLVNADIVDEKSLKFSFHELSDSESSLTNDQLIVTTSDGKKSKLRFPGCYRIKLSFRLKVPLKNPYIETFMRMGTNLPCQADNQDSYQQYPVCTNISRPVDWCPQTQNKQMRTMLRDKTTWFVYLGSIFWIKKWRI
jgi:hypothetical protein